MLQQGFSSFRKLKAHVHYKKKRKKGQSVTGFHGNIHSIIVCTSEYKFNVVTVDSSSPHILELLLAQNFLPPTSLFRFKNHFVPVGHCFGDG